MEFILDEQKAQELLATINLQLSDFGSSFNFDCIMIKDNRILVRGTFSGNCDDCATYRKYIFDRIDNNPWYQHLYSEIYDDEEDEYCLTIFFRKP